MGDRFYLLTGATGLLGGNIVRSLADRGAHMRALALPGDAATASLPPDVEVITGSVLDPEALDRLFAVPDGAEAVVIHAAGIVTIDPRPNAKVQAVNVDGTRNIIERCLRHQTRKLVYISSTSAIPEMPASQTIYESDRHDPGQVIGHYAQTKAIATDLVLQASREQGLDASVVYPSGIFGPNDYGFGLMTRCILMVAQGRLPVMIGGSFNSVDARDLAAGIVACADRGRSGETYIMASDCHAFSELTETICRSAGVKRPPLTVPLWLVRPFAGLGALYGKLTRRPPWFSAFTIYNLERNNNFSSEKAIRELGFTCRPLQETVADTIDWLKREGKLP